MWKNLWFDEGVARGCGWQELGAVVNLGAFYGVGVPISLILAFVFHMGTPVCLARTVNPLRAFPNLERKECF
jgi:Na+-driven multidrug efflux pump